MKLRFEYAILGALMKHPMHGYEIYRFLSSSLSGVWYVGMSNMYGTLKRLEADGHVTSAVETDGNRPAKRVFVTTENGREFFRDWISKPVQNIRDMRVEFITKLYFFRELGLSGGDELVERQKTVCREILDSLSPPAPGGSDFGRLLFDFRSCQIQSILSWLEACPGFLEESSGTT
jgi:DNA-binding PadR family transcriptional regulator